MMQHPDRAIPTSHFFISVEPSVAEHLTASEEHEVPYPEHDATALTRERHFTSLAEMRPATTSRFMTVSVKPSLTKNQTRDPKYGTSVPLAKGITSSQKYDLARGLVQLFDGFAEKGCIGTEELRRVALGPPPAAWRAQERMRRAQGSQWRKTV